MPKLRPRLILFAVSLIALSIIAAGSSGACYVASAVPRVISIAGARALSPGAFVTVEGGVTVPSGAFKSSTSDQGFAIQDESGGIYVATAANLGLGFRRQVRVTGHLVERDGLLVIMPADAGGVEVQRGRGRKVAAQSISTGRIGEATEGRLVQVRGRLTSPVSSDLPYGYRLFINDGSGEVQAFVYASTSINLSRLQPGQRVAVTGLSIQYKEHYEIAPRFPADIQPLP